MANGRFKKPARPSRGRGSVRRGDIEALLTGVLLVEDTPSGRNAARERTVRESLQETGVTEKDIKVIISDLPSYEGWEIPPGNIDPMHREV